MIEIRQSHLVAALPEAVAAALVDADVLRASIPNCTQLRRVSDGMFWGMASVGILKFRFDMDATITVKPTPQGYTMSGTVRAGPVTAGTIDMTVILKPENGRTRVDSHAKVKPTKAHGKIVMSAATAVSRKLLNSFFERFSTAIRQPESQPIVG